MLIKTNAIVISKLKYRSSDLIVRCYTQQKGIVSYILRGVLKSKKGLVRSAYFQWLTQLEIEEHYKANQSLHTIKEVKLNHVYQSLHTHVAKSAIAMFLVEVLSEVLKEEEENKALYSYLETTLLWLDQAKEFSNFHLMFLLNLTKYLGFYPDVTLVKLPYFNLSTGAFEETPKSNYSISGTNLLLLKQMLGIKFEELHYIKLNASQRLSFLEMLLFYYELHFTNFKTPKSLAIFTQVFN